MTTLPVALKKGSIFLIDENDSWVFFDVDHVFDWGHFHSVAKQLNKKAVYGTMTFDDGVHQCVETILFENGFAYAPHGRKTTYDPGKPCYLVLRPVAYKDAHLRRSDDYFHELYICEA